MRKLMKEKIYILILKSTFDAMSDVDQNKILNGSISFNKNNLPVVTKSSDSLDYYVIETNRRLAKDCVLNEYGWCTNTELLSLL